MCGIVAYVGAQRATPILLEGLQRLEYRGYDSAGIAVLSDDGDLQLKKTTGKLKELVAAVGAYEPSGSLGIGHTRWATHGRPNNDNAHPHTDCHGDIMVAHNGIIENYAALRDELLAEGHVFRSETDTESLAHLIERELETTNDLAEAVRRSLQRVTGSYAIVVVSRSHPGRLVGARLNGPLIVGLGEHENFLASDIPAILRHTRRMIALDEGDVADVTPERVVITTLAGAVVQRPITTIEWDIESAEKGGYPHFFVKEIHEQPDAVRQSLMGRIEQQGEDDKLTLRLDELDALAASGRLDTIRRVVILGCGTASHAGMIAKYAIERWARLPVEIAISSEYRYADPVVGPETLCITLTQSGETIDTLVATRLAREAGASVIAITNVVDSAITRSADATLYLRAGPEISVAATKTFVTMLTTLYLLGMWLGQRTGALSDETAQRLLADLRRTPDLMRATITGVTNDEGLGAAALISVADRLARCQSCLYIGRSMGYPLALEGALKLKELSYVHAEGYAAGEMKHGPIALLDPQTPLIAIATESAVYEKVVSNIQEARAREAAVIALASAGDTTIQRHADALIYVPRAPEFLSPLLTVIPLQLLAYHVALKRGCDIDQPRNLAKSVTVE